MSEASLCSHLFLWFSPLDTIEYLISFRVEILISSFLEILGTCNFGKHLYSTQFLGIVRSWRDGGSFPIHLGGEFLWLA